MKKAKLQERKERKSKEGIGEEGMEWRKRDGMKEIERKKRKDKRKKEEEQWGERKTERKEERVKISKKCNETETKEEKVKIS